VENSFGERLAGTLAPPAPPASKNDSACRKPQSETTAAFLVGRASSRAATPFANSRPGSSGASPHQQNCANKPAPFHFQLCHGVTNGTVFRSLDLALITEITFVFLGFKIFSPHGIIIALELGAVNPIQPNFIILWQKY